jgi:hypothetical protein
MLIRVTLLAVIALSLTTASFAQIVDDDLVARARELTIDLPTVPQWLKTFKFEQSSFSFVRIRYDSYGYGRRQSWTTDYPDADLNFATQIGKFTSLDVSNPCIILRLTDPELKKHPFIYIAEPSSMTLSKDEVVALREYLNGGGFLLIDDFWGSSELAAVQNVLKEVFPDRKSRALPLEHPLFHCVFDLKEKPQVLSIHSFVSNAQATLVDAAQYYTIDDDNGRVMVLMCHNTDLADGWERAGDDATYKRKMSEAKAFPMGFNIAFYALTHGKAKSLGK